MFSKRTIKMRIKDFGEFALIERIKSGISGNPKNAVVGIGDDCAVLKYSDNEYMIVTTDSIAEHEHFSRDYFSPKQIGMKAVEANISDIAAKGGKPLYFLVSLFLPEDAPVELVDGIYEGINFSASKCNAEVIGGNLSKSNQLIISICAIGTVDKRNLVLRSGAKTGDPIFCTGGFGASSAGLELLRRNMKGKSVQRHLEPKARLELGRKIAKMGANSMIDASDGLADIRHICEASHKGALIYADKIPISSWTKEDAKALGKDALELALYGGEDYELIFTAPKSSLEKFEKMGVKAIGEIKNRKYGVKLFKDGKQADLMNGFDHFNS